MKVCIGGTFDIIHKGHKTLIDTAFVTAGKNGIVLIGITTDKLVKNKKNVKTLKTREKNLREYLSKNGYINRSIIVPISDKYGPAVIGNYDAIVVSEETFSNAEEINNIRRKKGKKLLKIVKISMVKAYDNQSISTTRIRNGEIDENGKKQG